MVMTKRKPRITYCQVLENVRALPLADQARLRAELEKMPSVYVLRPTRSPAAIRRGRRLAAQIRKELEGKETGTLEETMMRLRGRSWA
jgi:hypothetical protein